MAQEEIYLNIVNTLKMYLEIVNKIKNRLKRMSLEIKECRIISIKKLKMQ